MAAAFMIKQCPVCRFTQSDIFQACPRCAPQASAAERREMLEKAIEARPIFHVPYCDAFVAMTEDGILFNVRDAHMFVRTGETAKLDTLVRELQDARDENTKLHAENSRLRHRLESK